ncbi:endonuclease/exonuclease/phosphatase family protein [Streptomyces sp. NPDC020096]
MAFLRSLQPDILTLQECNGFELLGRRRLHRAVNDLGMARCFLAMANETTAGHRFHTAILVSERVRVLAEGADVTRYHHVMGWATVQLAGVDGVMEIRHLHLDPFDPRNRAREIGPLEVLAAPDRHALVMGDFNAVGINFPEPDWSAMGAHLLNGHLRPPGQPCVSDREAVELLDRAGFRDAAALSGMEHVPTAAFGQGDVPRRQDLILASPTLLPALANYQVHRVPVDEGLSDHCAVSVDLRPARLPASRARC